ncbi:MAG: 4-alpha-glucanotransferase [Clostridiales bacterium]|jgi:4-alpha-glucanotransferase|nr:4-alpha-glucanotransferase [Clostridiales bacterium]
MKLKRKSGILAHPTSFPSHFGIGDLGEGAYEFIAFLVKSGAGLWQTLPLGPTSFGDSPYQSFCAFAGNPLLISLDLLSKEGFLSSKDIADTPEFDELNVDYGAVITYKTAIFKKAFENFKSDISERRKFEFFRMSNKDWLRDYALFIAVKNDIISKRRLDADSPDLAAYRAKKSNVFTDNQINDRYYGAVWNTWPENLKRRDKTALNSAENTLFYEIEFCEFLQYCFFEQWRALKSAANAEGIEIIGDMPIFVPEDSSDVWSNPHLFNIDEEGDPLEVAGVPPDYFSDTGQLWGNPTYHWANHRKNGYDWWIKRIAKALEISDILRIDHFRGFDEYWSVPFGSKTAVNGEWRKGPGAALFERVKSALGDMPIIVEDLGVITESVEQLRDGLGLPGMNILQFGFEGASAYLPHNIKNADTALYTGTHDNDTAVGWYEKSPESVKDFFRRYMNVDGQDPSWDLIRLAYASSAAFAIIPIQDVLRLGSQARMNTPGTPSGNWRFRYSGESLAKAHSSALLYFAELFDRLNDRK